MTSAGKVLQNRYSVNKQIGAGGMGTVYVATDQRFGSTVAIKETLFTDPNLRRAFEREAQLLNSLRHPALPRVSDHFTEGNGAFIVMEYIAGEDLSAMVERDGAFAVSDVLRWADNLLDALDYLHNQKFPVIHRDIKPQNLKLTPRGEIILLDFGLAKGSASELSQISMTKSVFGYSRSYAPLEQIQGTGTDPRSDLYGLAATLYHLVTGKPPVDALTRATAVLNGNPDPLPSANTLNSKIPVSVSNVFHQAMALNANLRPMTAAQMRFALVEAEKNFETTEFYDSTATLSDDVSTNAVYMQNTQLMESRRTEQSANSLESTEANQGSTKIINSQDSTNFQKAPIIEQDEPTTSVLTFVPRRTARIPLGIAASILLFGGAVFAFYSNGLFTFNNAYANSQLKQSSLAPESSTEQTITAPPGNLSDNSNTASQMTVATAGAANISNKAEPTVQTKPPEAAKNEAGKNNRTRPPALPQTKLTTDETGDLSELKDVEKEIDEALNEEKDKGNGFDGVPPELRSNDPRNPVDRQKLKIFIKKQRDAALEKVREANRLRAQQGLPPIPPRMPKVRIRQQRQNNETNPKN